jgi:hypothetical protein
MRLVARLVLLGLLGIATYTTPVLAGITFTGTVRDCASQPVPNVVVYLRVLASGTSAGNPPYGFAGAWCVSTFGPYTCNDPGLPCCNSFVCIGGQNGIQTGTADNVTYTLNIQLQYSGQCQGGGEDGTPGDQRPDPHP